MFKVIFKREYLNIVKKRAFWLTTFLLPLGMALLLGLQIIAQLFVEKESYKVWVMKENTPVVSPALVAGKDIEYVLTDLPLEQLKAKIQDKSNEVVLKLPDNDLLQKKEISFTLYHGKGNISEPILEKIRKSVKEGIKNYKQTQAGVSKEQLEAMNFNLSSNTVQFSKEGSKKSNTYLAMGVAGAMNTMMYMLLAIYGGILMQSVIEEKSNRIVEIIVSSVEPFQLMLGKTVAVAMAGLTQFLLWGILSIGAVFALSLFAGSAPQPDMAASGISEAQAENIAMEMMIAIKNFNWSVLYYFPFYFLGGFFLYGSIYAAAASLVDNPQDAQQFVMPFSLLSVLPLVFMGNLLQNPNGNFAIFCSMFPLFSPMGMIMRLSLTSVPWYQILISLLILIGTFFGCIWLAGKVYRIGILMYGKKPSIKEVIKWVRYS